VARSKGTELSIFKGREAKLNRAIFQTLALKGPQTIYDTYKRIRTQRGLGHVKYASVNKRVRALEECGYLEKGGEKKTKAGFSTNVYDLTDRTYLALLLSQLNLEWFLRNIDEVKTLTILAIILA
jgi:DNA-binding MarR family transcriptional regulator